MPRFDLASLEQARAYVVSVNLQVAQGAPVAVVVGADRIKGQGDRAAAWLLGQGSGGGVGAALGGLFMGDLGGIDTEQPHPLRPG